MEPIIVIFDCNIILDFMLKFISWVQHSKGCLLKKGFKGLFYLLTPALQVFCGKCCRFSEYLTKQCLYFSSSMLSRSAWGLKHQFSHTGELLHFLLVQKYLYYTIWWGWPSRVRREESRGQKRSCRTRQRHWRDTVTCSDPLHWAVPCTTTRNKEMSHRRFFQLPSYGNQCLHVHTSNKGDKGTL